MSESVGEGMEVVPLQLLPPLLLPLPVATHLQQVMNEGTAVVLAGQVATARQAKALSSVG